MISALKVAIGSLVAATLGGTAYVSNYEPVEAVPSSAGSAFQLAQYNKGQTDDLFVQNNLSQKRVSITLDGTISDLVKWLTKEGVSFVIDKDALKSKRINVNIKDQPLEDLMSALGEVMGGTWSKKGSVYTFNEGVQMRFFERGLDGKDFKFDEKFNQEQMLKFKADLEKFKGDVFKFELDKKELEKLKGIDPKFFEFRELKEMKVPGFDKKELEQLKRDTEQLLKEQRKTKFFSDSELKDLKEMKVPGLDKKELEQLKRDTEQLLKEQRKTKFFTDSELKELKEIPKMYKELDLKRMKELKEIDGPAIKLQSENFKKLLKSLTPAQKELQKSRGFLLISDLTSEQKKLLGTEMKGDFSVSFNMDGESVVIKSTK